ncbi:MAG TPA: nuclear transport factor 2 family protein [Solirubrobacteraceae bacterium]
MAREGGARPPRRSCARCAKAVVDAFRRAQQELYLGGEGDGLDELMAHDIVWHVPGTSPIAGDHRGREAVMDYFVSRRQLAGGRLEITQLAEMHDAEAVVQLADGRAALGGRDARWRTAGVYRVAGGRLAEAWLVPLDQARFDDMWAATRPAPFVCTRRVDGLAETFDGAFLDSPDAEPGLALAAIDLRCGAPVRRGDEVRIEVSVDRRTPRSLFVHGDAFAGGAHVAQARARYDRAR